MATSTVHRRLALGDALAEDVSAFRSTELTGVAWSLDSPQLNANLVMVRRGDEMVEHVNNAVDVLLVSQHGSGTVMIDDTAHPIGPSSVVLIPRGSRRSISTDDGLAYFSIHQRRGGLSVG